MVTNEQLQKAVVNILNGHINSTCRLCLQEIEDDYVFFDDLVVDSAGEHRPLSQLVSKLVGDEISSLIQGIESVCISCVEKVIECTRFIRQCSDATSTLFRAFDTLECALNQDFNLQTQKLYVRLTALSTEIVEEVKTIKKPKRTKSLKADPRYNCKQCSVTYPNQVELNRHICTKEVQCHNCNALFKSKKALKNHIDKGHTKYICSDCGKSCPGLENLIQHERTHKKRRQDCPNCGKLYLTSSSFENHVELCTKGLIDPHPRRCDIVRAFECNKCSKKYSTAGGLRVHQRFAHGNAKPHICEHCGKKFTAPSCLKTHMVTHTKERNFECNMCGRKCVTKEALLYHTRRHTGEKPYPCKLCPERFVNASARAEHLKYKHQERNQECHICKKKFIDPVYLKKHISKHSDRTSKLYSARTSIPPNVPGFENMRVKLETPDEVITFS